MISNSTLEGRRYRAEDRMYEVARALGDDLHQIEHRIDGLRERIHELVCRSGRVPIEEKTEAVLGLIGAFVGGVDFATMSEAAGEVASLKAEIDFCEGELGVVPKTDRDVPVALAV